MKARKARLEDATAIYSLIARYVAEGLLLPRTEEEIREHIGHFLVLVEDDDRPKSASNGRASLSAKDLLGCVALEPYGKDLAEIRSLAVNPETRGRGLGARLLRFALAIARRRKIARVFAVTHAPEFFGRQGFVTSTRWALPEKLERDCRTCPKAPTCKLVAVIATLCPERVHLPILTASKPIPVS